MKHKNPQTAASADGGRSRALTEDVSVLLRRPDSLSTLTRQTVPAPVSGVRSADVSSAALNFMKRKIPLSPVIKPVLSEQNASRMISTEEPSIPVNKITDTTKTPLDSTIEGEPQPQQQQQPQQQPHGIKRQRRRRWLVPKSATLGQTRTERDLVLYYLRAPASFVLVLVMSARNLATAQITNFADGSSLQQPPAPPPSGGGDGENLLREMVEFNKKTLEEESGRSCSFSDELLAGPSLVFFQPPITVTPTFAVPLPRISTQNTPPFEYVIGRSHQTLEHVPATARRWFSRRHCVVQVHAARFGRSGEVFFMLRDLRSANGTFLNGRAVPPGCAVPLYNGDLIGVSMTDSGAFMLGFRFIVQTVAERVWRGEALIDDITLRV